MAEYGSTTWFGGGDADPDGDIIRAEYRAIKPSEHEWVSLTDLRPRLAARGWSREQQDDALRKFVRARKGNLVPASNQKVLTQADRDAFLNMGNENRLHIAIYD